MSGLKANNGTRMTSVQLCVDSVINSKHALRKGVEEYPDAISNADVADSISHGMFWVQLDELNELFKPLCVAIMSVQSNTMSDVTRLSVRSSKDFKSFRRDSEVV